MSFLDPVGDQGIRIETVALGLFMAAVTTLAGFASTRAAKNADRLDAHGEDLGKTMLRTAALEKTVDHLQHQTGQSALALADLNLKVELIRQSIMGMTPTTGIVYAVDEIQRLVGEVRETLGADHALLKQLSVRVKDLEIILRNHPSPGG